MNYKFNIINYGNTKITRWLFFFKFIKVYCISIGNRLICLTASDSSFLQHRICVLYSHRRFKMSTIEHLFTLICTIAVQDGLSKQHPKSKDLSVLHSESIQHKLPSIPSLSCITNDHSPT